MVRAFSLGGWNETKFNFEPAELDKQIKKITIIRGRLAQLVERFPYKEDVGSSSLSTPTIKDQMTFVIVLFMMVY